MNLYFLVFFLFPFPHISPLGIHDESTVTIIGLLGGLYIGRLTLLCKQRKTANTNIASSSFNYIMVVLYCDTVSIIRLQDLYWIGVVLQYLNDPNIVDNTEISQPHPSTHAREQAS